MKRILRKVKIMKLNYLHLDNKIHHRSVGHFITQLGYWNTVIVL